MALVAAVGATAFAAAPTDPVVCESVPGVNDDPCPEVLTRWSNSDTVSGTGIDQALDTALLPDGRHLVVAGNTEVAEGNLVPVLLVVDAADGEVVGATTLAGHDNAAAEQVVPLPTGDVVVVIESGASEFISVVDPLTGDERWSFQGPAELGDRANGVGNVRVSPDGASVAVTTSHSGGNVEGGVDGHVTLLDAADGAIRWTHRLQDAGAWGTYRDVAFGPDGSVYAVGSANAPLSDNQVDAAIDAFDAEGRLRWTRLVAGPGSTLNAHDSADAVAVTPDGATLVISGMSTDVGQNDTARSILTMAFATADGDELWRDREHAPTDAAGAGDTNVGAVVIDPTGSVAAVASLSCAVIIVGCVALYRGFAVADGESWDHVVTGVAVHTLPNEMSFSDDGSVLRALSSSVGLATISTWNSVTGPVPAVQAQTPGFSVLTELDPATGEVRWESRYNSGQAPTDYGFAGGMAELDGGVVVAHTAAPTVGGDGDGTRADIELVRWER